jgi:hypothetical protein
MRNPITMSVLFAFSFGGGCSKTTPTTAPSQGGPEVRTVRLHIDGFKKSRSGAV